VARITSKLQVTIPKAIARRYGIEPGQEIDWLPAGEAIRVVPQAAHASAPDRTRRLEVFDRATERQRARQQCRESAPPAGERGWRRDDLYDRGSAR
jgi:bifunctional DNA-binding transcriptional regulator/antitoxin component of YhaV-PrlF toxin-antitoxin module